MLCSFRCAVEQVWVWYHSIGVGIVKSCWKYSKSSETGAVRSKSLDKTSSCNELRRTAESSLFGQVARHCCCGGRHKTDDSWFIPRHHLSQIYCGITQRSYLQLICLKRNALSSYNDEKIAVGGSAALRHIDGVRIYVTNTWASKPCECLFSLPVSPCREKRCINIRSWSCCQTVELSGLR